jgi:geranylgeranyl diphosphate synthase type II
MSHVSSRLRPAGETEAPAEPGGTSREADSVSGRIAGDTSGRVESAGYRWDEWLPLIEQSLADACSWGVDCPTRLGEAIRYSLLAPGKRIRPILTLMAAEAVGGRIEAALSGAVAVEMIHAYSLVHDDLPAMDDDDLRRGRPTTHIAFDEATAILAGDSLIPLAFEHLATRVEQPGLAIACIRRLALASGPQALVGGQSEDLAAESGGEQTLARLEAIHRRKTGALIDAAVEIGGLLGGGTPEDLAALASYSRPLGLAFQVVDDCLDHSAADSELGKRTGKDLARGKLTYPGLMGLDAAQRYAETLIDQAIGAIAVLGNDASRLKWMAEFVRDRTR